MWIDKVAKRTQREDFVEVPHSPECGRTCPHDGHSVGIDNPEHYDAIAHAETRVRALHAVQGIRAQAFDLVSDRDLTNLMARLLFFDEEIVTIRADRTTRGTLNSIRFQLATLVARRLTAIKKTSEDNAYVKGSRDGVFMYNLGRNQF